MTRFSHGPITPRPLSDSWAEPGGHPEGGRRWRRRNRWEEAGSLEAEAICGVQTWGRTSRAFDLHLGHFEALNWGIFQTGSYFHIMTRSYSNSELTRPVIWRSQASRRIISICAKTERWSNFKLSVFKAAIINILYRYVSNNCVTWKRFIVMLMEYNDLKLLDNIHIKQNFKKHLFRCCCKKKKQAFGSHYQTPLIK